MNTKNNPAKPLYRVTFARILGKDDDDRDILAHAKEIGAVWPRRNGKQGGVLTLDIIPVELAQRKGVLFLLPVDAKPAQGDLL
ncbi:MAG TPA: hypothetical protein VGN93_17760 [Shinella sp.]|uniref:hypothetical protein n=1 Tax=Shinella sp. TaxID=1870904 RepID=UPI002E14FD4D|nr:hypothetical protein [Shinella sp.]